MRREGGQGFGPRGHQRECHTRGPPCHLLCAACPVTTHLLHLRRHRPAWARHGRRGQPRTHQPARGLADPLVAVQQQALRAAPAALRVGARRPRHLRRPRTPGGAAAAGGNSTPPASRAQTPGGPLPRPPRLPPPLPLPRLCSARDCSVSASRGSRASTRRAKPGPSTSARMARAWPEEGWGDGGPGRVSEGWCTIQTAEAILSRPRQAQPGQAGRARCTPAPPRGSAARRRRPATGCSTAPGGRGRAAARGAAACPARRRPWCGTCWRGH